MRAGFRISGLRHMVSGALKKKIGVRNYRIFCSAMVVALVVAIVIPVLSNKEDESFAADALPLGEKAVEVRFLNTQTDANGNDYIKENGEKAATNEANLIKTKDGKYVLIDTGDADPSGKIISTIYNALKSYQGQDSVVVDYLIISHLDGDHYGNAASLIKRSDIKVNNVIIKYESTMMGYGTDEANKKKAAYDAIVTAAKSENAYIYTNAKSYGNIQNYSRWNHLHNEGTKFAVGDYLNLYIYNTVDLYSKTNDSTTKAYQYQHDGGDEVTGDCKAGYYVKLASNIKDSYGDDRRLVKGTSNWWALDNTGGAYPNVNNIASQTSLVSYSNNQDGFNRYFYAELARKADGVTLKKQSSCRSNGNAYGVLAEVKTNVGNKYMYFANDLDNFGYDIIPTSTNIKYYDEGGNLKQKTMSVYGNGRGVLLDTKYVKKDESKNVINLVHPWIDTYCKFPGKKNANVCTNNTTDRNYVVGNKVAAETRVALEIADKLGSDLSNLVIYQQSHHGNNNAPDAINELNLNRSGVYAIANRKTDLSKEQYFIYLRSYHFALGNAKKLYTGGGASGSKNGVYCAIDASGNYRCGYKTIVSGAIVYNANGGTGAPASQTCLQESVCSMTISNASPTREGYKFLGWSKSSSASTATYSAGQSGVSIAGNTTFYAVWQKQATYTLVYDANGGTGAPANQTCVAVNDGTCSLKISNTTPTRNGYVFAGWDTVTTTLDGSYKPGSTIVLNVPTRTLYAIWKRVVNVNTSVNGTGGRISSSITGIEQGTTVAITFTPDAGYEIDNVKVDGETVTVTDNHIEVTVSDEDVNVVVTFKKKAVDPTPTPDPDPTPTPDPDPTPTPDPEPDPTRTFILSFSSANGGSGFPTRQTCTTTTGSCTVTVPSTPVPTRSGYVFLGYGFMSNRNEVVIVSGTYELTGNTSFVAIWAPVYTLTLDANGGTFPAGVETTLTCNPTTPNGICTVELPGHDSSPTKEGYSLFGYAMSTGSSVQYVPGNEYTFIAGVRNTKLYAIWGNGGEIEWIQGQEYVNGTDIDLILRVDYPVYNFRSLTIDGNIVDNSNYDVASGSTIISVHSDYLNSLPDGDHSLVANYSNGVNAITAFSTVTEHADSDMPDDPSGGDDDGDDGDWDDPDVPDDPTNPDGPDPVDPSNPDNSDTDKDDYIPVPNTSAGAPDTGENIGSNIGGNIAATILPIVLVGLAVLVHKKSINKTHRKFD